MSIESSNRIKTTWIAWKIITWHAWMVNTCWCNHCALHKTPQQQLFMSTWQLVPSKQLWPAVYWMQALLLPLWKGYITAIAEVSTPASLHNFIHVLGSKRGLYTWMPHGYKWSHISVVSKLQRTFMNLDNRFQIRTCYFKNSTFLSHKTQLNGLLHTYVTPKP